MPETDYDEKTKAQMAGDLQLESFEDNEIQMTQHDNAEATYSDRKDTNDEHMAHDGAVGSGRGFVMDPHVSKESRYVREKQKDRVYANPFKKKK